MLAVLKKWFGPKEPVQTKLPFYDIVCPYCFAKFHHEEVVFRATHHKENDEAYALQEDERLKKYRDKFNLHTDEELEAVIHLTTIAEENWIYSDRVLVGISDHHSVVTRKRLCPECHNELPVTAGKHPSNIVSIVGASSVGKSVYMTALIHTLQNITANNFGAACMPLDQHIHRRFQNEYETPLFEHGSLLASTQITKRQEPFIFQFVFKEASKAPLTLVFFDVAGDGMVDEDYLELHAAHIKNSSGILLLVDPMQIKSIREKLIHQMGTNSGDIVAKVEDPRSVVISLFKDFIAHQDNSKTSIPTAVILTKSDLLHSLSQEDGEYIRPNSNVFRNVIHRGHLNLDEFENINGEIRRFLEKVDVPFVNSLDVNFTETAYFAVSALGSNPVDQQVKGIISPIRVDEPFIWLLHKLGYVEGRYEQ